jgi:hypothetical protein
MLLLRYRDGRRSKKWIPAFAGMTLPGSRASMDVRAARRWSSRSERSSSESRGFLRLAVEIAVENPFALHGADVSEIAAAAPATARQRFWYCVKT